MNTLPLWAQIQSILFVKTDAVSISWLSKTLSASPSEVAEAIDELRTQTDGQGVVLVTHDQSVMLATHPDMATFIETLYTREITTPLSKSALETLAIILYSGPLSKSEIDHIRGVNSQFMLRNLLVRGLIEKKEDPEDKRRVFYQSSSDTMTFLGITKVDELPNHDECMNKLEQLREHRDDESIEISTPE